MLQLGQKPDHQPRHTYPFCRADWLILPLCGSVFSFTPNDHLLSNNNHYRAYKNTQLTDKLSDCPLFSLLITTI